MREAKSKRLAAIVWKLGTAKEFLGLDNAEEAYTELLIRTLLALGTSSKELSRLISK